MIVLLLIGFGLAAFGLRLPRVGFALAGSGFALFVVLALSPLGLLMMNVLEERFPKPRLPAEIAGIIVLGGSFDTVIARTRREPELNEAADRITATMALSRQYPNARVIFSGGSASMIAKDISETIPARELMLSLGLEADRLLLEDQSRNTAENASFTKAIADPQPGETWLLVTSAYHMPRAVGCFRIAGFDVVPYPVDYRTPSGTEVWSPSTATVRNVEKVHFAIREFLGLAAYRISGRTDAFFPSP